ncbi:DNA cytosine methyltransferase [Bacillus sp. es.034]|uniref:DNA cytosine methyltransferase n=1 Tax=Bacillus sp. es.034 TaxID=1761763 RepID=UPI000BF47879|nr:DNA cytosine methyltransferase [Bacillus sp. es.034]
MKIASFFAGVGGIDKGFEMAGFETVYANEIDEYASKTFKSNFDSELEVADIANVSEHNIPEFDMLVAGFPCQAFSVAGYRKGFADERGNVFFELLRIIAERNPSIVFLENVKNLVGHDGGNTFNVILEALSLYGYTVKHQVLNACEYGNVPQNRERIYIVGFRDEKMAEKFYFPNPTQLSTKLEDVINFDVEQDEKYYYRPEKCAFYDKLEESITGSHTIYQWRRQYVRENKSNVCPTLTANMGTGGHNVPLIYTPFGIRKLTPRECFNIQGFPKDFVLPELSNTRLYKQAGNSVVVPVIHRIAENIKLAINQTNSLVLQGSKN